MDLSKLMEQAKKMQDDMKVSQEDLSKLRIDGSSGGGMVKATMNGNMQLLNLQIEDEIAKSDDKEMLEDLIVAAVNATMDKVKSQTQDEMQKKAGDMLGGMDLSGIKFPGM